MAPKSDPSAPAKMKGRPAWNGTTERVLRFIAAHPGATGAAVRELFGPTAQARLSTLAVTYAPRLRRERHIIERRSTWHYHLNERGHAWLAQLDEQRSLATHMVG